MATDGGTRHHCSQHQISASLEQVSFQLTLERARQHDSKAALAVGFEICTPG